LGVVDRFQYHPLGSLDGLSAHPPRVTLTDEHTRIQLALDYFTSIAWLHASPVGVRVMCDGALLLSLISQFLITSEHRLLVSDVDVIPEVDALNGKLIRCGKDPYQAPMLHAPEQGAVNGSNLYVDG
jgi:hypothetical protein